MGRKKADRRLEILKETLLERIAASEDEPDKLKGWLSCYKSVVGILEAQEKHKEEKKQAKLATPR